MKKLLKALLYIFLLLLVSIALIAATAWALTFKHEMHESHNTPYVRGDVVNVEVPNGPPTWQVILLGDAGDSILEPWEKNLTMAADLASIKPKKTSVVMLGDNIYLSGYPNLEDGEVEFDEDQLELIDRLNAQLQISKISGAELVLVPGNHDWYASQVDTQAKHVLHYAKQNNVPVSLQPWVENETPLPTVAHRDGVSMIFIDTQWLITADQAGFDRVMHHLDTLLASVTRTHPENLILATGHHPIQTMGPHAQYYTSRTYAFFMELIDIFFDIDQDLHHGPYMRLTDGLNKVFTSDSNIIYAAGHEHSLQIFEALPTGANYQLVSGAANQSKVSGVGHNDNTLFAVSMEGLMRLSLYSQGPLIEVISSDGDILHRQWLK